MSDVFTATILPVVRKFAIKRFPNDEDKQALMWVIAWHIWVNRKADYPASNYAQLAARNVYQGRDLPGLRTPTTDALMHAESGGGMDGLADHYPGPEQLVMDRERYTRVIDTANDRERELIRMFEAGKKAREVADALKVSPGRVTQLRQGLMDKG